MFKRRGGSLWQCCCICFNPSVGILGVQAATPARLPHHGDRFQSLGRDSGCSSGEIRHGKRLALQVSIPRSGFWVFKQFLVHLRQQCLQFQSLGRDSGCSSSSQTSERSVCTLSFNPSVGILGVQATPADVEQGRSHWFQSLGRDSGCSSSTSPPCRSCAALVSIPRSGFWVFKQQVGTAPERRCHRFNPSVGILGVQAVRVLSCVSGQAAVSIPRSGFWVFKLTTRPRGTPQHSRFNPSVGILGVQAGNEAVV